MELNRRHILALGAALAASPLRADDPPIVFAAASLKAALDEISQTLSPMRLSYGGSGALARQITQGAPADLFVSANVAWMDVVEREGKILEDGRRDLLGNKLVIIGMPAADQIELNAWQPDGRIAMGFVNAVPAGQYGKAAFEAAGLWDRVKPRVVEVENVRAALALVVREELPYAVVYASDAQAAPEVSVLHEFSAELHPQITYSVGVLSEAGRPAFDVLQSAEAASIFAQHGFEVF